MNLVLIRDCERLDGSRARLAGSRAAHLLSVLRCEPGRRLRVGVPDGPMGWGTVTSVADDSVLIEYTLEGAPPPRPRVDLLLALPRPKVLGRILEHVTAIGVGRIVLTNAWRVEKSYFQTRLIEPDGYRPRLLSGLEQAVDTRVPEVHVFRRFKPLVEDRLDGLLGEGRRAVAHPGARRPLAETARGAHERFVLAVGPEGGWLPYEIGMLEERGFASVSLGERVLRVETACTLGLGQVVGALAASDAPTRASGEE